MSQEAGQDAAEKRKAGRRLHRVLWGLLIGCILFAALLPHTARHVVNRHVLPRLSERKDGLRIRLAVPSLDYTGLTAVLSVGSGTNAPAFEAGSIRVGYAPGALMRRRIRDVTVHGAVLYLERSEDGWWPRGIPGGGAAPPRGECELPEWSTGSVRIPGARVVLLDGKRRTQVTCDIKVEDIILGPDGGKLRLGLSTIVAGALVEIEYRVTISKNGGIKVESDPGLPPRVPSLRAFLPDSPLDIRLSEHQLHFERQPDGRLLFSTANRMEVSWTPAGTNTTVQALVHTLVRGSGQPDALTGTITADTEGFAGSELPFQLGRVQLQMPFGWPIPRGGCTGQLSAEKAAFGDLVMGPLDLECVINDSQLSVYGLCAVGASKAATAHIDGSLLDLGAKGIAAGWEINLPLGSNGVPLQLRKLLPTAPKGDIEGTLTGTFTSCDVSSPMLGVRLDAREIRLPDQSLSLTGLKAASGFDPATATASERHQRLTIEEVRLGSLTLRGVEALYDVEADGSVFLESARAQCSGGAVEVHALRIVPGAETFEVVLRGDRLRIRELFAQLGLPAASGDGALSGRVPVRLEKGRPRFENGFLFTTPGRPGVISFGDTDAIAGALAQGAGQNAQVALVGAALKAFSYEWITVTVNSEDDILMLVMTISGRPERNIPFRYENKSGTYVVTSGSETGSRPPMVVNLNFRIPLDEVMKYTVDLGK